MRTMTAADHPDVSRAEGLVVLPPPGVRPPRTTLLSGLPIASEQAGVPAAAGPFRPRPTVATISAAERGFRGVPHITLPNDESFRLPPIDSWDGTARGSGGIARIAPAVFSQSIENASANADPVDFSDPESQRVLTAAARAVARELGREAAREYFAELLHSARVPE
jgi:hypothetical protein